MVFLRVWPTAALCRIGWGAPTSLKTEEHPPEGKTKEKPEMVRTRLGRLWGQNGSKCQRQGSAHVALVRKFLFDVGVYGCFAGALQILMSKGRLSMLKRFKRTKLSQGIIKNTCCGAVSKKCLKYGSASLGFGSHFNHNLWNPVHKTINKWKQQRIELVPTMELKSMPKLIKTQCQNWFWTNHSKSSHGKTSKHDCKKGASREAGIIDFSILLRKGDFRQLFVLQLNGE